MFNKNLLRFNLFSLVMLFLFSCSEESASNNINLEKKENVDLVKHLNLDSGEVKVFTMPAPLQVSTLLRVSNQKYYSDMLIPPGSSTSISFFRDAISLGMLIVDLGYETVYEHQDICMEYVGDISKKMENLNIDPAIGQRFVSRFDNNRGNQDSLCQIILEGYRDAHDYFQKSSREEVGILILTGAFIEGAFLGTQADIRNANFDYDNLIIQQKLYLENIVLLLGAYQNDSEFKHLYDSLLEMQEALLNVEIVYYEQRQKHVLRKPLFESDSEKIKTAVEKIRNDLAFE